ncbi:hypothetical protein BGZ46_002305 [Entomortierella lignicola]|nr:hypothetical protein BGZ46_002305 [Entomortierella lignicola]
MAPNNNVSSHKATGPNGHSLSDTEEEEDGMDEYNDDRAGNEEENSVDNDQLFAELDRQDQLREVIDLNEQHDNEQALHDTNDDTSSLDSQDDVLEPIPDEMKIQLNFRRGNPKVAPGEKLHLRSISKWPPKSLCIPEAMATMSSWPGLTTALIKSGPISNSKASSGGTILGQATYRKNNPRVKTPIEIEIYAYLKDITVKQTRTIQRQTRGAIEDANRRINEARQAGRLSMGPITQTMFSRDLASRVGGLDEDQPIQPPPDTPLYNQSRLLDERLAEVDRQDATLRRRHDRARINLYAPGCQDHGVIYDMDIGDLRKALGFDLSRIRQTTRDLTPPPIPRPREDVPDTDHS